MHADRVDVLHRADRDGFAGSVAHGLELDLLPPGNGLFDQHLRDGGQIKPRSRDRDEFLGVGGDAAAGPAERERRTDDDGIPDPLCDGKTLVDRRRDVGGNAGLPDLLHRFLEEFAVLRPVDGGDVGSEEPHARRFQEALFFELHRQGQTCLSAQSRKQSVGLLAQDDALDRGNGQRLEIDLVRQMLVGHNGRGVGIDQNGVDLLLAQNAARLRARVIEFGRLPDHDRAGTDDENFFDTGIFRHCFIPVSNKIGWFFQAFRAVTASPP